MRLLEPPAPARIALLLFLLAWLAFLLLLPALTAILIVTPRSDAS
jgi:hypothetical protein